MKQDFYSLISGITIKPQKSRQCGTGLQISKTNNNNKKQWNRIASPQIDSMYSQMIFDKCTKDI